MNPETEFDPPAPLCPHCFGTGIVIDQARLGATLRARRERCGIGLREMARRLGLPVANLFYLEKGQRHWSLERHNAFINECTQAENALDLPQP